VPATNGTELRWSWTACTTWTPSTTVCAGPAAPSAGAASAAIPAYDGVVDDEPIDVRDNPEAERYEAIVDGRLAGYVAYRARPGALALTHTDVLPRWEGRGIGGRLARAALDDARARGLKALPYCPFIAAWIRRHPEYEDLVPEEELGLLDRRR
jgi:uncharacterized protein